jgi:SpoVK/Ycf46/Vps4 family AAA+-type ATPase
MIIKLNWDGKNKQVIATPDGDFFITPNKLYGDTEQKALRVWNDYVYYDKTTGCLLTGAQGTGKTLLGELISNIAIRERNMPVYMLTCKAEDNHDATALIEYINNLRECVVFMDEFGKMIKYRAQDQFLTMLSDLKKTKKIFILTENSTLNINSYILNRPGRIKYHFDYTKISRSILTDYCRDKKVSEELTKAMADKHDKTNVFSFDQLEAIVDEHRKYPNETLHDILEVLNADVLRTKISYRLSSVFDKNKQEYVEFKPISNLSKKNIGLIKYEQIKISIARNKDNNSKMYPDGSYNENNNIPSYFTYQYFIQEDDDMAIQRDDCVVLTTPEYIITYVKEEN